MARPHTRYPLGTYVKLENFTKHDEEDEWVVGRVTPKRRGWAEICEPDAQWCECVKTNRKSSWSIGERYKFTPEKWETVMELTEEEYVALLL